jgi:hypothetical protein
MMAAAATQGNLRCLPDKVSVYRVNAGGIFSAASLSRNYERNIEMLHALLTFADPRYYPIIKKRIDTFRIWLCLELVANGQLHGARKLAWETFWGFARYAPKRALGLIFHVYLPRTFRLVCDAWYRHKSDYGDTKKCSGESL